MFEHIRFDEILRSVRKLQQLSALAFPRNTDFWNVLDFDKILWPPNLQEVTLSGFFADLSLDWVHFAHDWPPSLQHLILDNCHGLGFRVGGSAFAAKTAVKLHSVSITDRSNQLCFQDILFAFSGLRILSVPANLTWTKYESCPVRPVLEQLELRAANGKGPHCFDMADLLDHANGIPSLQKIRLHSSLLGGDCAALHIADELLRDRATDQNQGTEGSTIRPENFGVHIFDDQPESS